MNVRLFTFIFCILFLCINETYAQDDNEINLSEKPYYYSLKKALRNKGKAYKLDLSNSDLKEFPIEILELKELRYLVLDSNQITSIPETINLLEKLEAFSISNNDIQSLPSTIENLSNLFYLDLGYNRIVDLPSELFTLHQLETLRINNNNLTLFPSDFMKLKELRRIYASNNKFEVIPDEIGHLYNLETLSLSKNFLKELPGKFFELSNLEFLYLYDNQISHISSDIQQLKKLKKLYLGKNKLRTIDLNKLYELKELYLNNNVLESLLFETNSLINLSKLSLANNPIATLPNGLTKLKKLKLLYLEGNTFDPFPQVLYDLQNKGVEIKGLATKELYEVKLLLSKARNKRLIGNYEEAIRKYEEVLLLDTNNIQAMSGLASSHLEKGHFDTAKTLCKKALAKKPEGKLNQELKDIYNKCLTKTNENTALNSKYEEKYNENPSDATPYFELGKKYFDLKKYDEALVYFQKVVMQDPLFTDAHFYIAVVSLIQKQKNVFIFSTLRYLTLKQNGRKAETILPFLLSKLKMRTGVQGKNGNVTYYDAYIIRDDNEDVIYQSESATGDLLMAMLSDLKKPDLFIPDTLESDTVLKNLTLNVSNTNNTNVEIFQYELNNICTSEEKETEQSGSGFMNYYSSFYSDLIKNGHLETLSYIINSIRSVKKDDVTKWLENNPNKVDAFMMWSANYEWGTDQISPNK